MRPEAFEYVHTTSDQELLTLRSQQRSPSAAGLLHLTCLALLAGAVVLPQIWVAAAALSSPDSRQLIVDRPVVAFELAVFEV